MPRRTPSRGYTEAEMAHAFKAILSSPQGLPGIGPVWRAFEEVNATRGRPDFVAIVRPPEKQLRNASSSLNMAASSVLASLYNQRPLTVATLVRKTGLAESAVRRSLRLLEKEGHARETPSATFLRSDGPGYDAVEAWAFELKLRGTKRAVFQAQQYRMFAQRVVIVVPPGQLAKCREHAVTLNRWGIGVATFDPISGEFRLSRRPRRGQPVTKGHQEYVLSRIVNGH